MEWHQAGWSLCLPLHHKVQKFSSGTGSPGWSQKKGCKRLWWWCCGLSWLSLHASVCMDTCPVNATWWWTVMLAIVLTDHRLCQWLSIPCVFPLSVVPGLSMSVQHPHYQASQHVLNTMSSCCPCNDCINCVHSCCHSRHLSHPCLTSSHVS